MPPLMTWAQVVKFTCSQSVTQSLNQLKGAREIAYRRQVNFYQIVI